MAPKRKLVSSVVKTSKKVVEMVIGTGGRTTRSSTAKTATSTTSTTGEGEELIQEFVDKESETITQVETPTTVRSIPIEDVGPTQQPPPEDEEDEDETQEPEEGPPEEEEPSLEKMKIATPPRVETPPSKDQKKEVGENGPEPKRGKRPREAEAQKRGPKRRRKRNLGGEGYRSYVYRVLKQVHPDLGISAKAMTVLNNFMSDMFERLAFESGRLSDYGRRRTMSAREVQTAVRLLLPGELGKHAVAEGSKAITLYVSHDD